MDTDLTLCNSPEVDKSSQVQKIAKKMECKLFLSGGDYNHHHHHHYQQHQHHQQQQQQQTQHQNYPFSQSNNIRLKPTSSITNPTYAPPSTTNKNRLYRANELNRPQNSRNIKIIKVDPSTFHKKVNKSVMMNQRNIVVGGGGGGNNTVTANTGHNICNSFATTANRNYNNENYGGFNPFADENDSSQSFQLSKTTNYAPQSPMRLFGSDVTNFVNANQPVTSNKTKVNAAYPSFQSFNQNFNQFAGQNFANLKNIDYTMNANQNTNVNVNTDVYGKSVFRSNDSNQLYLEHPTAENSCSNFVSDESQEPSQSQSSSNNEMIFKNYDLNDEYWLNFDQ